MTDNPIPLSPRRALPPFPVDALPEVFAAHVAAVAEFTQTDPGMAGTSALTVLAACAGGRCEVEVRDGWNEPLNIFTATIAEPGERKSAVQRCMVAPLLEAERALVADSVERIIEAETTRDIAMKAAEKAKSIAGNADEADKVKSAASAVSAAMLAEAVVVPTMPRIVADDVTPEAVGSLMAEQKGRLAIISAEGGIFDILAGRYSGNANLDTFLKGHAGDTLKVDRKGRPPEYIPKPALTVGLMIQPSVLVSIAKNGSFRGRGLQARFLFAQPPSKVGRRKVDATPVPAVVREQYDIAVTRLATNLAEWEDPAVLPLDDDAVEVLLEFARRIEPELSIGARLGDIRDWGSKLVGATARMAGLLHLGADPDANARRPIGAETIVAAIALAEYFTDHALAAFDAMQEADPVVVDAEYLLEVIKREGSTEVSRRDLFTKASRSRFATAADLDPVITRLVEHSYLELVPPPEKPAGRGRPPSPKWTVHPSLLAAETAEAAQRGSR